MRPLLEVQDLVHAYGERFVLTAGHWTLHPGQVVALVGPSGSGKTTLLRALLAQPAMADSAVLINELGAQGLDHQLAWGSTGNTGNTTLLANGCVCCTIREDLRTTLRDLAERRRKGELDFERLVIETTGLADPGPVAQTFFMDDEVAESYLLDSILTLVDAKHAPQQLNDRQEARRQVGFADQIFISKSDLVDAAALDALQHRLKHMNPRAPQHTVHFGEIGLDKVFDLRGFNLNTTLEIDPDFLNEGHDHHHHDGEHCDHPSHAHDHHGDHDHVPGHGHHHHHDDDVKSFVFKSERALDPAKLEDFLGAIVNIYGPRMLRYKGVLHMKGTERKVIFQGVHQLMGSDLGQPWEKNEKRMSKMVFIGIDLPRDIFMQGLEQCLC